MIIKSLTLLNFKSYEGKHFIDLSLRNHSRHKNIVLIGGLNGAGKTSILEAIKLCLYGKKLNGYGMSPKEYERMILSKVNSTAISQDETRCSIQLVLQLDDQNLDLTISRDFFFKSGKLIEEKFTLMSDGKELEIIPREMWEDYVFSLIPPHIADFFFFDGERVKEIASGPNSKKNLRDVIESLFDLKKYENLQRDLTTLVRMIKHRNVRDEKVRKCLEEKQRVLLSLKKEIKSVAKKIQHKESLISKLKLRYAELEKEIHRKAGEFASKKNEYQERRVSLERNLLQIEKEIEELCERYLPFIVSSKICKALLSQLKKEREKKNWEHAAKLLEKTRNTLVKKLTKSREISSILTYAQKNLVINELNKIFLSIQRNTASISSTQILHDLSDSESIEIETFLSKINRNIARKFKDLLNQREKNRIELQFVSNKLQGISEGIIDSELSKLADLRSKITTLENEILSLSEKKNQVESRMKVVHEEIEKLEEQIVCVEDDERKIETCLKTISAIEEFKRVLISDKIKELETKATKVYRQLANKGDLISRIEICPESFDVNLIDFRGNKMNKENLSAGEQEIYAISVLWGLAQISGYKIPIIIDTPLAKLDSRHTCTIARNFFPAVGHQVILLSQDREIDAGLYKVLKPFVDHSLLLSLNGKDKVREGYFYD